MKSIIIMRHIKVENANAIAGLTWGFPAISNFLGFTHALSRFVEKNHQQTLGGCAVICHQHNVQTYQPSGWGEHVFALTRNPLTKEGKTAPFNEEARMHMDVTLIIECDFSINGIDFGTGSATEDKTLFTEQLCQQAYKQRLAGGTIQAIEQVEFRGLDQDYAKKQRQMHKLLLSMLPGFALVDRSSLLAEHYQNLQSEQPDIELLDAWLDFAALKYQAEPELTEGGTPSEKAQWHHLEKPSAGYLVPITVGYKGISPLYQAGEVANTRDSNTPFRFVESAYGIGQWLSPHRVHDIEHLIWRYYQHDDWYLCQNHYPVSELSETPSLTQ